MANRKVTKKRVVKKNIAKGIVYISATFNNTTVTVTDEMGNVISWSSAGALNFKGSKKSTPYAAQQAVEDALNKAKDHGIKEVGIKVQGIKVLFFKDITPLAHNGCRPPKRRRV